MVRHKALNLHDTRGFEVENLCKNSMFRFPKRNTSLVEAKLAMSDVAGRREANPPQTKKSLPTPRLLCLFPLGCLHLIHFLDCPLFEVVRMVAAEVMFL
jgi:hypothetical protein